MSKLPIVVDFDDAARECASAINAMPAEPAMPEICDPWTFILGVVKMLTAEGLHPTLRAGELYAAEATARELILCLGLEPSRVGGEAS